MTALQTWMDRNPAEHDGTLAPRIGVSRVQVSRIRRDVCKPSIATAQKLEVVTGIPAAKFVMGDAAE